MERTKYIPSIISLAGAFVACLVTIVTSYDTLETLLIVLAALIVFYIVGSIIRVLVNKLFIIPEPEEESESGEEENSEEQDEESEEAENEEAPEDDSEEEQG